MSIGLILVILLVIALFGGFSGRFGGYGYGYGHGGIGVLGVVLIVVGAACRPRRGQRLHLTMAGAVPVG